MVWASPRSLAATYGVDFSFFSTRYLDVSVPWVRFATPMNSACDDRALPRPSFLIQKSPDRRSFASFPELIAGYHVFRRFSMPRHPPCTLKSLTTFTDHRQQPARGKFPRPPQGVRERFMPACGRRTRHRTGNVSQSPKKGARRHPPETPYLKRRLADGKDQTIRGAGIAPQPMAGAVEVYLFLPR